MEEIKRKILKISSEIDTMNSSFKVYRTIIENIEPKIFEKNYLFWASILNSLFSNFIISFCRIVENNGRYKNDNLSIPLLIRNFEKLYPNNSDEIETIREKFQSLNTIIKKIKNIRDTKIGHSSLKEINNSIEIKKQELDEISKTINSIKKIQIALFERVFNDRNFNIKNNTEFESYFDNAGDRKFHEKHDKPTINFLTEINALKLS